MPYFKWRAIDLTGKVTSGVMRIYSYQELENYFFAQEKALLRAHPYVPWHILRPIRLADKITFFKKIAMLIGSGVFLDRALAIVTPQMHHHGFCQALEDLSAHVSHGASFYQACAQQEHIFTPVMLQMVYAGQESGKLAEALEQLCVYLEQREQFYKQVQQAAFLPVITLGFFCVIAFVLFVYIVPIFASMFLSTRQELPWITTVVLSISTFLSGSGSFIIIGLILLLFSLLYYMRTQERSRFVIDYLVLKIPLVHTLVRMVNVQSCMQSVALLVSGGVDVVQALTCATGTMANSVLKKRMHLVVDAVERGMSLSTAIQMYARSLFLQEVDAIIQIGEESGRLAHVLSKINSMYQEQLTKRLLIVTTLLQPALMIILGMLIACLIFAIYVPIFNLSSVIS